MTASPPTELLVAGVDGWRGGWVIATVAVDGKSEVDAASGLTLAIAETFAEVMAHTAGCHAVGVDMPLALPTSGTRASDQLVKDFLGPAGRSLFRTLTRAALNEATHADAVRVNKALGGKGPSAQGWGLSARIREVRNVLLAQPDSRIFETHPESSFTLLHRTAHQHDGQAPQSKLPSKKTAAGVAQRLQLLNEWVPGVVDTVASLPSGPGIDDALDAIAAAWSAARVAQGKAQWFGSMETDEDGLVPAVAI